MRFFAWFSFILLLMMAVLVNCTEAEDMPREIARAAERLAGSGDATGGLIVHVGCTDGKLPAVLSAGGTFLVHGLVSDRETLEAIRADLVEKELHGHVTLEEFSGDRLPYVDDMVNFIVVEQPGEVSHSELMRVLVPNGVAYVKSGDTWEQKRKDWPEGIDEWSHWLHGPDNNAVSTDERVGISRSLQWYMPPRWTRHHNLPAGFNSLVSGGGRAYYFVDQAPPAVYGPGKWALVARDAFNGLELWRRDLAQWHMEAWGAEERYGGRVGRFHGAPDYQAPRRIVVAGDRLFVTLGFHSPVSVLDGATGEVLDEYPETRSAGEMIYQDGILYVARNTYEPVPGKEIMAVDTDTGKTLWKNGDYKGIAAAVGYQEKHTNAFITAGEKCLFLVDQDHIVALDLEDGQEVWKKQMALSDKTIGDIDYRYANFCTLVYRDGRVFFCQIHPNTQNLNRWEMKKLAIEALDAESGELLWDYTGGTLAHVTPPDLFVHGGQLWTLDPAYDANGNKDARLLGLDCQTGSLATDFLLNKITHGHHHRCYRNKATEKYYLMGEEGIEYIDFETGETDIHYWLRGACRYGIMPANGLIYVPPHNCGCYLGTLVHGLVALKAGSSIPNGHEMADRLARGPAYGSGSRPAKTAGPADWPMFRHDPMRSCGAPVRLPKKLAPKWTSAPGGQLTPPVIVGDQVFLASRDTCQLYGLNAANGELEWQFAADGPINAPPTFSEGCLVFGSRAGTLYAVTADEGQLMWRLRAGPARVRVSAFGRLESPWPLNGSPLVMDGNVYCVAGRSMSLDGGIHVYKVDLRTGELLQEVNLQADTEPKGETDQNFLADMLVSDGESVYMKSMRFNMDDITRYSFQGASGRRGLAKAPKKILRCQTEMVDDSWLNCCFWAYRGCQAQQLVFDETAAYGINGPSKVQWGGSFAHDVYRPSSGYRLHKWAFDSKEGKPAGKKQEGKNGDESKGQWRGATVDHRARSMVLTDDCLYFAGTPDKTPADDFWAAYENRKGALMLSVSRKTGKVVAAYPLESEPVYNGMAAAGDCLYVVTRDGNITCWGPE
ncbi:MAG: PQQ-binding-like beta-propeller repeat protein [Planctomycetota bacterium]